MNVYQLMNKKLIVTPPDVLLPKIWTIIFEKHIHSLPVVDKNHKLLGIIAEEDLLKKLFPDYSTLTEFPLDNDEEINDRLLKLKKLTAAEIMNKRVLFTRSESHIMRALSRMIIRKVRQLPVLDENNRIIGMITKGDIFDWLFKRKRKKLR